MESSTSDGSSSRGERATAQKRDDDPLPMAVHELDTLFETQPPQFYSEELPSEESVGKTHRQDQRFLKENLGGGFFFGFGLRRG